VPTTNLKTSSPAFSSQHLASFVDLLAADLSPTADLLVYAANTRDGESACESSVLWLQSVHGGGPRPAAPSDGSQSVPAFSADGRSVVFLQEVDGRDQVCVLDLHHDEARTLTNFSRGVAAVPPSFSPDGDWILFAGCDEPPRDPHRPYRVDRPVWRRDGMGLVEDVKADLHLVPSGGGKARRLTYHDGIVSGLHFSPDGRDVLYGCFAEPGSADFTLRTVDTSPAEEGQPAVVEVTRGPYLVYPPAAAWLPDGRLLHTTPWEVSRQLDLVVVDRRTGSTEALGLEVEGQIFGYLQPAMNGALLEPRLLIDEAGERCLLSVQRGGRLDICAVALTGPPTVTGVAPTEASSLLLALRRTRLLIARTSFAAPLDLYLVDLENDVRQSASSRRSQPVVEQITSLNASRLPETPFRVHPLTVTARDGTPVEGWFLEPTQGVGPFPTVLNIHGGPFAGHGEMFSLDDHLFAAAGLGVLSINFRGSSGYGEEFAAPLWGDWGHLDASDLLDGVDAAVTQGWVDPARLGSFGLSGGGYLTSWLLTHSDRFAAGVAECPVTDWNGMVGSDIPQVVALWMGSAPGTGAAAAAQYARVAPLTFAADCTAPLLIVVHEHDLRCPPGQGDVLYNALTMARRHVEMLRLPGMSHTSVYGFADLAGRTDRAEAVLEWFRTHLQAPRP